MIPPRLSHLLLVPWLAIGFAHGQSTEGSSAAKPGEPRFSPPPVPPSMLKPEGPLLIIDETKCGASGPLRAASQRRAEDADRKPCQPSPPNARQGGFTLMELLVVMVIIGLLAGYVAPKFFAQIGKSEVKVARAQMDALGKALDQYRLDVGRYPSSDLGLNALVTRPDNDLKWQGPYLAKGVPNDPWGRPYVYRSPGEHGDYDLISYGHDGRPGGTGEDADITNW